MLLFLPVSVGSLVLVYHANASSQWKVRRTSCFWHISSWPFLYGMTLDPSHPSPACHTMHFIIISSSSGSSRSNSSTVVDIIIIERYSMLSSRLIALMWHAILNEWLHSFSSFLKRIVQHSTKRFTDSCLLVTWLVHRKTAAVSAQVLCTPYNHAPIYSSTSFKGT